jgi:uncharacterized membrane protein (DUF106 family)
MFVFSKSKTKSNVRKSVDELEEDFREQTRFRTPNKHKQMQEEERRRRHHQHQHPHLGFTKTNCRWGFDDVERVDF